MIHSFLLWARVMESAMADSSAVATHPYILICFNKAIASYRYYADYLEKDGYEQLIYNATMHNIIADYAPSKEELEDNNIDDRFKQMLARKYKVTAEPTMPTSSSTTVSTSVSRAVASNMETSTATLLETKYGLAVHNITQHLSYLPIGVS